MRTSVTQIDEVREAVATARSQGKSIGFVPTMGALHEGHARLVQTCRAETGFVVVSIFVNPTQFAPTEDFSRYPRTIESDRECCREAGADLIFEPSAQTMYPGGSDLATFVEVPEVSARLEGKSRPTHFRGVTTVVLKLFAITQPDLAYFGAKDYQQQLIIRRMVQDMNLPVIVRTVPTVREPDGLALSSRNRYLSAEHRQAATVLSRALASARSLVQGGEQDANRVRQKLSQTVESEREARLDYAEVADSETLETLQRIDPARGAVGLLAVRFGETRLIDNATLTG